MAHVKNYRAILFSEIEVPTSLQWEEHPSLEALQKLVGGGLVEVIRTPGLAQMTLLVNEEGLQKSFTRNLTASLIAGRHLVGPALLLLFEME